MSDALTQDEIADLLAHAAQGEYEARIVNPAPDDLDGSPEFPDDDLLDACEGAAAQAVHLVLQRLGIVVGKFGGSDEEFAQHSDQ